MTRAYSELEDVWADLKMNPVILPKGHVATLLVRRFHEEVCHQGRHITEGALRSHGYWVIGAKKIMSSLIHSCISCRKLRGQLLHQKMADLPLDQLIPGPPFTAVGVDVFGPWPIITRRTRGGVANGKRWAVLFTCLTTRGTHIEVLEDMTSSCFINAIRRFEYIRGPVKVYRSDGGTNFVGAVDAIKANVINVEDQIIRKHIRSSGSSWYFNLILTPRILLFLAQIFS